MVSVQIDASPKQLSRLRNGHKVRIKKALSGMGFNLIVDPSKFDPITRSFAKGSAYQIQLSPDEIMANKKAAEDGTMEGQGLFSPKKLMKKSQEMSPGPKIKKMTEGGKLTAKKIGKAFKKAGEKTLKGLTTAEEAVRENPISRAVVGTVLPMVAEKGLEVGVTGLSGNPFLGKLAGKAGSSATKAGLKEAGYGLYAGQSGRGLYAGGAMLGPRSRMPEVSSISIGGNLLSSGDSMLNPAMRSDAMSANFHMNTQLPPQYQRGGIRFV